MLTDERVLRIDNSRYFLLGREKGNVLKLQREDGRFFTAQVDSSGQLIWLSDKE